MPPPTFASGEGAPSSPAPDLTIQLKLLPSRLPQISKCFLEKTVSATVTHGKTDWQTGSCSSGSYQVQALRMSGCGRAGGPLARVAGLGCPLSWGGDPHPCPISPRASSPLGCPCLRQFAQRGPQPGPPGRSGSHLGQENPPPRPFNTHTGLLPLGDTDTAPCLPCHPHRRRSSREMPQALSCCSSS